MSEENKPSLFDVLDIMKRNHPVTKENLFSSEESFNEAFESYFGESYDDFSDNTLPKIPKNIFAEIINFKEDNPETEKKIRDKITKGKDFTFFWEDNKARKELRALRAVDTDLFYKKLRASELYANYCLRCCGYTEILISFDPDEI